MQRPSLGAITTPFGQVAGYPLNNGFHQGVDFSPYPDPYIYAPEDGAYRLYPNNGTLGNAIHMWVGNRHHAFGHTSEYLITDNQTVRRGTRIAKMGATGAADGVHLHWALAINNSLVDPLSQVNEAFIGGANMGLDLGQARVLAHGILGRNGFDGRPNALNGDCDADLNKNHVGKDAYAKIWEMYNSGEAVNFRNSTNVAYAERDRLRTDLSIMTQDRDGLIGKLDSANKTIADQTSTIGSLQQQVNDLTVKNTQLQAENDELNKKLASIGDAASNLSGLELIKLGLIKIWKDIGSK